MYPRGISTTYDADWGDLLTAYDGVAISYDEIGNPLSDGTWTYTWEHGRELTAMSDGTTTWTYTYNADGLRTSRTNGTTTYKYVYNGSSLTQMTVGSDTLYFTDATVTYNNTVYYYVKNIQGDIIAILDSAGVAVVEYSYDAWGNILSTTGELATTLGAVNPLRYRGYVYDSETGLYYLQSRYYDPEVGRFLNADGFASTGHGIRGCNMFAYCLNSPIGGIDLSGTRTYFINGISNDDDESAPEYAYDIEELLEENEDEDVKLISVYNGQVGLSGIIRGVVEVVQEMLNENVYSDYVAEQIMQDLEENPLAEGETVNIVAYSGGGQIALNVMEKLDGLVDNVVLIGTPVMEITKTSTQISVIYAGRDPLSWLVGFGYQSYYAGDYGHWGYFSDENIEDTAKLVGSLIR